MPPNPLKLSANCRPPGPVWRYAAVICAKIHEDLIQPADEVTASAPDDVQRTLHGLNEDVAQLNDKVDAIMVAMMQLKR